MGGFPLKNLVISYKPNLEISMFTEQIVVLSDLDQAGRSVGSLPQNRVV